MGNQREILRFLYLFFIFVKKKFFWGHISTSENFEANAQKTFQKIKKRILQMCLRFQFCTHQRACILYFIKKIKFVVP
jgi:hypothetical protein